jgi:integrase
VIQKMYSELTTSAPIPPTSKKPFTDEEVDLLWEHADEPWVDTILIFLYSGWRISELLGMKREDVDIKAGTMKGGVKTKSGIGRLVPIHSKILPFVQRYYNQSGKYLLTYNGKKFTSSQYYAIWGEIMNRLGMNHTPHECRHTFRSRLDSANANLACINRLMGHVSSDVGLQTYTHKTVQELRDAIELIKK